MKFHFNLFLLTFLFQTFSSAHNKVGNGGDVVDCKTSTQLLDFYEDENLQIKTSSKDYLTIAQEHFARFEKTAPKVFSQYQKRLSNLKADLEFKKNVRLSDIKDSEEFFLPKDSKCTLTQIAIRKKSIGPNEKRFLIDSELWNKLDETHKAGLISHEIIYEHLSQIGEKNSTNARKLNRFVFNEKSKATDFWKLVQDLKLPLYP